MFQIISVSLPHKNVISEEELILILPKLFNKFVFEKN